MWCRYRATRQLVEVALEGVPQSVLQAYIFKRVVVDGAEAGIEISVRLLVQSLVLSLLNLAKVWWEVLRSADAAGISVRTHLLSQLRMGVGLPLDALKKDAITRWQCAKGQLEDIETVKQLAAALKENHSLRTLKLSGGGVGAEGAIPLADALRVNDSITEVCTLQPIDPRHPAPTHLHVSPCVLSLTCATSCDVPTPHLAAEPRPQQAGASGRSSSGTGHCSQPLIGND